MLQTEGCVGEARRPGEHGAFRELQRQRPRPGVYGFPRVRGVRLGGPQQPLLQSLPQWRLPAPTHGPSTSTLSGPDPPVPPAAALSGGCPPGVPL